MKRKDLEALRAIFGPDQVIVLAGPAEEDAARLQQVAWPYEAPEHCNGLHAAPACGARDCLHDSAAQHALPPLVDWAQDPLFPPHPYAHAWAWTEPEKRTIKAYGDARALAARQSQPAASLREQEDAARLDYLQSTGPTVEILPNGAGSWKFRIGGYHNAVSPDIRDAIDAQRLGREKEE